MAASTCPALVRMPLPTIGTLEIQVVVFGRARHQIVVHSSTRSTRFRDACRLNLTLLPIISTRALMGANNNFQLSLFEKLCTSEDPDFACPLYEFTVDLYKALEGRPGASINEVLQEKLAEFKAEEEQMETQLAVQQHAKDKLLVELKRAEAAIESLQQKRKGVCVRRKFAESAMSKVVGQESDQRLTSLSDLRGDDQNKLQSFLWLLRSTGVKEDVLVKGLQQFESFCILVVENPWTANSITLWMEIATAILTHLNLALPKLQIIELRILTEIVKRSTNFANQPRNPGQAQGMSPICNAIVNNNGLQILIRLLNSVNDDVKMEAAMCITATCNNVATKEMFGQLGGIEALINILNKSNSELVLQQTLIAIWNQAMCDYNKALVRTANGLPSIIAMLHMENDTILENATIALGYLTRDDQNKVAIRDCNGIEKLLSSLYYPNESIQSKAAGALWNCASNAENKVIIRQLGGMWCFPCRGQAKWYP